MNEVPGARERPGQTRIKISDQDGETVVTVPAQGLGAPLIALGLFVTAGLITFVVALVLFILERHSFFGVRDLLPTDNTPTQHWKWVIVACWIGLIGVACYVLLFIVRLGYNTQELVFTPSGVTWLMRTVGKRVARVFPYSEIEAFQLTHDPTGMRRSQLLLLTPPNPDAPAEEEFPVFEGATEEEKTWLESVCNILLVRYRQRVG